MMKSEISDDVNRRAFLVGTGTTALVAATAATSFSMPAAAGRAVEHKTGPSGLVEIAGRITNAAGVPHKQAYVEIIYQNTDSSALNSNASALLVNADDGLERFGVWTGDDGIFGLHTWWSNDANAVTSPIAAGENEQADVLFEIDTQDGNRSQWNVRLYANPQHVEQSPEQAASHTSVAWSDRANSARFVTNFTV